MMRIINDVSKCLKPPFLITLLMPLTLSLHAWGAESADLSVAHSLFKERCATAGENIKRTVNAVQGIFLLKLRPDTLNFSDQYVLDDPYGSDHGGDAYIESFLKAHHALSGEMRRAAGWKLPPAEREIGFSYVEAINPKDGQRYRYTAFIEQPGLVDPKYSLLNFRVVLIANPAVDPPPQYGVSYEDISTPDDRRYWIAGSSLKVIDLHTGEVIAERIGYMMDPGQGSRRGGRFPWLIATSHACPAFHGRHPIAMQQDQAVRFVEKVLSSCNGKGQRAASPRAVADQS